MHEITLCQSAFEIIEQHAKRNDAKRVNHVWLQISALSCVEESALQFCFDIVCRNTIAQDAVLEIEVIAANAWCRDCQSAVTVSEFNAGCPECSSHNLQVDSGDAMQIKQIEIE